MVSTILRGGLVLDGTGAQGIVADVGLSDGRIEVVGDLSGVRAELELDVTGRVVAPGFVDVHTHSDLTCFLPGDVEDVRLAAVRQGVTTEVVDYLHALTSAGARLHGAADPSFATIRVLVCDRLELWRKRW